MRKIKFLGTGDALGSGGRMQSSLHVEASSGHFLIDCGASALIGMKRFHINPEQIELIIISHLHGDHFGGIPFFILDAQFSHRTKPLLLAGPPGVKDRTIAAMEILFPGLAQTKQKFPIEFLEFSKEKEEEWKWIKIKPFEVIHPSGAPAYALRVESERKVLAYSGDTEWDDKLLKVAYKADIFICEAYFFEKKVKNHLSYQTLLEKQKDLKCQRLILTHLHNDVLDRVHELKLEWAQDGQEIYL